MVTYSEIEFTFGGATTVAPDPAGILMGATNLVQATRFMDYLTSTEGQTLVGDYRTPVNYKANTASHIPKAFDSSGNPTTSFPAITPFSPYHDARIHSQVEYLFTNWIVQNHNKEKAAWSKIRTEMNPSARDEALVIYTKLPSDCNGTIAGLRALEYKDSTVIDRWKSEAAANFDYILSLPIVTIDLPLAVIYTTDTVNVKLSGYANHYWYYIEPVDNQNQTWTASVSRKLTDGNYTLHAYGNDSLGNTVHSSVTFIIDTSVTTTPTTSTTTTSTTTTKAGITPGWNIFFVFFSFILVLSLKKGKKEF
ncbi:MAG: Ig-like domain-containing protein [Candidatus Hodarchaeota archaeon]